MFCPVTLREGTLVLICDLLKKNGNFCTSDVLNREALFDRKF